MPKHYRSLTVLFAVWLLGWLFLSWPTMQDDAFIHLRYAVHLLRYHMISYDGVHPDYGTSSLLYVWLLAGLRCLTNSPVMPRALSSLFHFLLFAGLAWEFPKALRAAPRPAWTFAILLLGILVTPMAVRWLDDGMETSLTLCLITLLAFAVSRLGHAEIFRNRSMAWLASLGFLATVARVEYLLLMTVASMTLFFARSERMGANPAPSTERTGKPGSDSKRARLGVRQVSLCGSPLAGGLLAAELIYATMHSLLPDTAVAKADLQISWADKLGVAFGVLKAGLSVFVSSMSIGIVLLLFWALTLATLILYRRRLSLSILTANSLFPVALALAMWRGQEIQGVRYLLWTLVFPLLWNTLELRWSPSEPAPAAARVPRFAAYGLAGLLLVLMPIESALLLREFRIREGSLAEFRGQRMEQLRSMKLVAYDIGYIGYFTESPVCDLAGLVNGRAQARLTYQERVDRCAAERPQYAFLRATDLGSLNNSMNLKNWSICSVYDFANLRGADPHYLIASPAAAKQVCAASGGTPRPAAALFGGGAN
ncbi:MAG: hypothetical protein ACLGQU_08805 [Acidobacteriota bacterium]